ncbi:MAG: hypothetical protein AUJ92_06115 [Armatimonadetes bacterium CG2_30_59_28]|nr:SRPBCC family protein [Armatimonadota bacterium]OIO96371.1 MAG: hypothetical protein AUJ92_06115 [Armatimonadetes bacterium CG2_30_59_28]PIU66481.1 MAG: cyclase [Armatimonadetes bacterium CG07_land_8_20_14_0_80_59_28]PIX41532.1 MAG: cyclase [Armatimonadetes bacterium CG_4_8_14_3_um_filter_58_9]
MPTVLSEITIDSPPDAVYALAKDVEKFPDFMPDIESVKIVKDDGRGRTVSEWVGKIRQFNRTLKWTEEDFWNDTERVCEFKQTKGDFTEYGGVWRFSPSKEPNATEIELQVDYVFDIPLIGNLIKAVLQKLVQQNADSILQALKKHAEQC